MAAEYAGIIISSSYVSRLVTNIKSWTFPTAFCLVFRNNDNLTERHKRHVVCLRGGKNQIYRALSVSVSVFELNIVTISWRTVYDLRHKQALSMFVFGRCPVLNCPHWVLVLYWSVPVECRPNLSSILITVIQSLEAVT